MHIAVIGAGISGLSAAWLLSKRHRVTLFEKEARLGGHSDTVEVAAPDGPCAVDMGFIVYNTASYPNLIALFDHLAVPTAPTSMGFSVSLDDGGYEYSGTGANGLFGQRSNAFRPAHWSMVRDILRFFREARDAHASGRIDPAISLGDWLAARRFGRSFVERHILPMGAAIWSTPAAEMLRFPAAAFIRFFANHGLLQVDDRPAWRTVTGGSREYVSRLRADMAAEVVCGDPVVGVSRSPGTARVRTAGGREQAFDAAVLACHADDALALLADPDADERRVLGGFRYARNQAVLHRDPRLMPKRKRCWAAWNYTAPDRSGTVAVTYWMNALQPLASRHDHFVTLNPSIEPDPRLVLRRASYQHPMFDAAALAAQLELWSLQGRRATWFAGSYFGYGFHEDGIQSGLEVAEQLGGVARPWAFDKSTARIAFAAAPHAAHSLDAAE